VDTTQKPHLSHISLCFGYGGIDLGLHRIFGDRLRLAAVCEIEAFALENALSKMEAGLLPPAPIWTDLRTFPWEEFQDVTLVSGGFPCQPFSAAGKREGDQDPRHLFPFIVDGIKRCRPRFVFLENVEGILSSKLAGEGWADPAGTPVLLHVFRELERVGYKAEAGIFSASETGAPHQRKRIFILAHREEQGLEGLRRLESDFIWNNASSYGTTRGTELGNANNYSDTEAGYAEAHRLQGEHWKDVCSGFAGGADATSWPSRPGEQQYAWEPPRVIGGKLADTNNAGWEAGRDYSITSSRGSGSHRSASHCGDQEPAGLEDSKLIGRRGRNNGDEGGLRGEIQAAGSCGSSSEAMGNPTSERSHRGAQDGLGLQPEMFGEGHENMGDSECVRLEHGREHAGVGETSKETEGGWSESTSSPQEPNDSREGEASRSIESQYSEAESSLGRGAYESSIGMDISELSGLSHSELAEIREWMFKTESRTDELRLLGNGVVRSTATRAFLNLFEKLK
jgi:site-specific DNA-cytosine methylase